MLCHPLISIKSAICCVTVRSFSVIKVNFVKGKTMLRYVSQGVLNNCLLNLQISVIWYHHNFKYRNLSMPNH